MDEDVAYMMVSILICVVWAPSMYFFNSWAKDRDDSDPHVIIIRSIFVLVTFIASPFIVLFGVLVLVSPFYALIGLYRLLLGLPSFCAALGPWCLSWRWVLRSARYAPRSHSCRLCGKCSNIVEQSRILRGTHWILTRPREEYDFYGKGQLQQSAQTCHLCSLLWHASFGSQTILAPAACSEQSITSEPDSTTPLLARNAGSRKSPPKISVEISATRPFGQEQSLHIRLCEEGSGSFQSLTIEDSSYVKHKHNCEESITGSESGIHWAQALVAKCELEHDHCCNRFIPSDRMRYLPKRLIDVRSRDKGIVQLVLGDEISACDDRIQYAALSHCWGTTVECELTKNNQETMQTILIETLDQSFRDAVDITYKMGIDYLWIDSLCIMQHTEEWEEQSADMGLVYARAKCVISATASKNSRGGCYKPQDLFPYDCVLCSCYECSLVVRSSTSYPDLVQLFDGKVEGSFLTKRGWTFQERFLASRMLHFCSGLMLFECNTLTASQWHGEETYHLKTEFRQDGTRNIRLSSDPGSAPAQYNYETTIIEHARISVRPSRRSTKAKIKKRKYPNPEHSAWTAKKRRYEAEVRSIYSNSARLSMRGAFSFLWSFKGSTEQEQAEFHLRWYEMVVAYSVRNLTKDGDKVIAITGVAYFIQQNTGLKYAAGLWDRMLPFNLLWVVDGSVRRRPSRSVATWSWASVDGKISHRLKGVDPAPESRSTVKATTEIKSVSVSWEYIEPLILNVEIEATHTVNGLVHNATLKLSGMLQTFDLKKMNVMYDTLESYPQDEIRCLPVLKFVNDKVHPSTRTPQIHGILVRAVPTVACQTEDTWRQYRRVGYFWTLEANINLGRMHQECRQLIELV